MLDRVQSVSNYTYAACGQVLLNCGNVSPFLSYRLTAAQLGSQLTPYTDGILVDGNFGSLPIFGFLPNPSSGDWTTLSFKLKDFTDPQICIV